MSSTRRAWARLIPAIVLLGVLSASGRAQQRPAEPAPEPGQAPPQPSEPTQPTDPAPPSDDQQPVFRTDINFVRVDAIITDGDGNPVTDLQASDFEILEDEVLQKVETFRLVHITGLPEPGAEPPRPVLNRYDEEREAQRDDVRIFVIFFDDYHVRRENGLRVQRILTDFLQTELAPTDLVAVMYPLTMLDDVRLTRDHASLTRAIETFEGRKYDYEPRNEFEQRYAYYPTTTVEMIRNDVSLSALRGLATHLGGLRDGRKSILLISEGYSNYVPPQLRNLNASMPVTAGRGLDGDSPLEQREEFFSNSELLMDLREVFGTANRNNTTIYTVDPRGLTAFEYDASQPLVDVQIDRRVVQATQDTLRVLAEETDGRAIVNQNDLNPGLRQMVRDSSAYYLLGYTSATAPSDGKFHEIEVRVKRRGVKVRARKGYWALTPDQATRALTPPKPEPPRAVDVALARLAEPPRGRTVRTWVGTSRGDDGKTRVRFVWEPNALPSARADVAARILLTAGGDAGGAYFRGRVPATLESSGARPGQPAATRSTAGAHVEFEAAPGQMQLSLAIEDEQGGVLDRDVQEIEVPDFTGAELALSTPSVLRARTAPEWRSLTADWKAVPTAAREFRRTDRLLIRFEAYAPGTSSPSVTARLLNRGGEAMIDLPVEPAAAERPYQVDLALASLPPGEYLVEVAASSEGSDVREFVAFRLAS